MLARLQQILVGAILVIAVAWGAVAWNWGHPAAAIAGALAIVCGHAPVLALEFVFAYRVNREEPTPAPSIPQWVLAWARETMTALRVFCWQQPFRSNAEPDHLPQRPDVGVLLVHGFACNRGIWNPWISKLRLHDVPVLAVTLEPVFGAIDEYVPALDAAVARLHQATGRHPLIVAHSMGGVAVRAWLGESPGAATRVSHVVTIGSPHGGTWLARFAYSANARQMRLKDAWLAMVSTRNLARALAVPFTCFYSHCDNIVFPASTATLPHADNRHVAGAAHVDMLFRPEVFDAVLDLQRRVSAKALSPD